MRLLILLQVGAGPFHERNACVCAKLIFSVHSGTIRSLETSWAFKCSGEFYWTS
jgi:hypothetical protein